MANYNETARSNYFGVKDTSAWPAFCARWGVTPIEDNGKHGFYAEEGLPSVPLAVLEDHEEDHADSCDFYAELEAQLTDGEVAVVMGCGSEAVRFVTGFARAICPGREPLKIDLQQIYGLVQEAWGVEPTACEY